MYWALCLCFSKKPPIDRCFPTIWELKSSSSGGDGYYGPPGQGAPPAPGGGAWGQQFPGQQIFQDPMANMAMQYGTSLAGQGKDMVNKNVGLNK